MTRILSSAKRPKTLAPVRPNLGLEAAYRRKLDALVQEMVRSVRWFVRAAYRANPPEMAQDELPADALRRAVKKLSARWERNFDAASLELAAWFARSAAARSDRALQVILRKAGFSVKFQLTPEVLDILKATIAENVSLIKSIPSQFFTQIEGSVMRSVTAGRDLSSLTKELEAHYGVTRRRAAFISLDQNNKATAAIQRTRQMSLGITDAIWLHSHGGKEPRRRHLAYSGKKYEVAKGAPVGDKNGNYVHPGEEVNCRCVAKPIVPGFS